MERLPVGMEEVDPLEPSDLSHGRRPLVHVTPVLVFALRGNIRQELGLRSRGNRRRRVVSLVGERSDRRERAQREGAWSQRNRCFAVGQRDRRVIVASRSFTASLSGIPRNRLAPLRPSSPPNQPSRRSSRRPSGGTS